MAVRSRLNVGCRTERVAVSLVAAECLRKFKERRVLNARAFREDGQQEHSQEPSRPTQITEQGARSAQVSGYTLERLGLGSGMIFIRCRLECRRCQCARAFASANVQAWYLQVPVCTPAVSGASEVRVRTRRGQPRRCASALYTASGKGLTCQSWRILVAGYLGVAFRASPLRSSVGPV